MDVNHAQDIAGINLDIGNQSKINKKKSPLKNMLARMKMNNESPNQSVNSFKSPGQSPKGLLNETGI